MKIRHKTDKNFINSLKWLKIKKENYKFSYSNKTFSCFGKDGFYYMTHIVSKSLDKLIQDLNNEKNNN